MSYMFAYMNKISSLDLSNFNTGALKSVVEMFSGMAWSGTTPPKVLDLDLSNFDTSNITSMSRMFYRCCILKSLNVSNFDTSNVTNMQGMFENVLLDTIDLSSFDTSNVTTASSMFAYNQYLKVLRLDKATFNSNSIQSLFVGSTITNASTNNLKIYTNQGAKDLIDSTFTSLAPYTILV